MPDAHCEAYRNSIGIGLEDSSAIVGEMRFSARRCVTESAKAAIAAGMDGAAQVKQPQTSRATKRLGNGSLYPRIATELNTNFRMSIGVEL